MAHKESFGFYDLSTTMSLTTLPYCAIFIV